MRRFSSILLLLTIAINMSAQLLAKKMPVDAPQGSTAYYELNIRAFFKNNNWHDGKLLLDTAIVKYSEMSAFHELMGRYYVHLAEDAGNNATKAKSNYDKARYYLIKSITIDEKNEKPRYLMLQVETATKHYSSAIVYANELLEENPYNENLWRKKIDLYRKIGNNAEADRLLERLATIYPNDDQIKKDIAYRTEMKALTQKKKGDRVGQEESLRQLIKMKPSEASNYDALANLLYSTGRIQEAADIAGQGANSAVNSDNLVRKRASMLCEMGRYREAVEYVKNRAKRDKSAGMKRLLKDLEADAARASQYNDPFISYAKMYESQHSAEALNFCLNTAIQRNYFDDALYYIKEMKKSKGETADLLYKEYIVNKRMGNRQRASNLLERLHKAGPNNEEVEDELAENYIARATTLMDTEQYAEALSQLEYVTTLKCDPELQRTAALRRFNCHIAMRQYGKAEKELTAINAQTPLPNYIQQRAMLLNASGRTQDALDILEHEYYACPDSAYEQRRMLAASYEEYAVPYIKKMISRGMTPLADQQIQKAMEICTGSSDLMHMAITTSQQLNKREDMIRYVLRGRNLFPDDPYYVVKDAQARAAFGEYREALDIIRPLLDTYVGDSIVIGAYTENSENLALECLKQKHPYEAMAVVDSALVYDNFNNSLLYTKGLIYEQMKDYKNAYIYLKMYKPGYGELSSHNRHIEEIMNHNLRNSLSFDYQQARLGSEDAITGNAYLTYTRKNPINEYSFMLSYAGRDGTSDEGATDLTRGGTGIQLGASWQHQFTHRFALQATGAWSNKYFPNWTARLSGTYDLPREWQLSAQASWRWIRSYQGIYGWKAPVIGYDPIMKENIYGDPEYVRTGWKDSNKSLWQLGIGVSKTIEQFLLGANVDGFMLDNKFYINGNAKVQFFPVEGSRTHFFANGGVGTAPESSLIDRSMPVGFDNLNTFVGMGGFYFINRSIAVSLSGTWYTLLNQAEHLTTNYIQSAPEIKKDYKNYFYLHSSVLLSF